MPTIVLEPNLMNQVTQLATAEAIDPDKVVENAVREYLRQRERQKIEVEAEAFRSLHPDLVRAHLGEYVAIHNRQVVDRDREFQMLHTRIRQRYGRQAVLIRKVESLADRELVFRSPRFEESKL
jgi:hypothetical protein